MNTEEITNVVHRPAYPLTHLPAVEHYQSQQIDIDITINWTKPHIQFSKTSTCNYLCEDGGGCSTQFNPVNGCTKSPLRSRHITLGTYPFTFCSPRLPHFCPLTVVYSPPLPVVISRMSCEWNHTIYGLVGI